METAIPRSAGRKRVTTAAGVTLPLDILFEVFLDLPAASVCRFRAVCRSWRDILSGRGFLAALAARRGPLLIAAVAYRSRPSSCHVDLVNLAGTVERRTRVREGAKELLACGDLACVVGSIGTDTIARLLDPATGAVTTLPYGLSQENKQRQGWSYRVDFHVVAHAFGRVSSTGEYKLLRLLVCRRTEQQLVEILTIDSDASWRSKRRPPFRVAGDRMHCTAVVDGIVYFLAVQREQLPFRVNGVIAEPGSIASFNLETEEWMPILYGAMNSHRQGNPGLTLQQESPLLTLTELNGFLVTVHSDRCKQPSMDLWFLIDSKPETWVKRYSIQLDLCPRRHEFFAHPLFVDDRNILLCLQTRGVLMVYDLQTGSRKDLDHMNCLAVGLYKGGILSSKGVLDTK